MIQFNPPVPPMPGSGQGAWRARETSSSPDRDADGVWVPLERRRKQDGSAGDDAGGEPDSERSGAGHAPPGRQEFTDCVDVDSEAEAAVQRAMVDLAVVVLNALQNSFPEPGRTFNALAFRTMAERYLVGSGAGRGGCTFSTNATAEQIAAFALGVDLAELPEEALLARWDLIRTTAKDWMASRGPLRGAPLRAVHETLDRVARKLGIRVPHPLARSA